MWDWKQTGKVIKTLIIAAASRGDTPPPISLVQLHLPRVFAVQRRLVSGRFRVEMHDLQVSKSFDEIRVGYPDEWKI